jgi:hypothetical protein
MIAIMIDRKLERYSEVIKYTFSFIFETLGYPFRFIDMIGELRKNELIFFYGLLEPSSEEKQQFTKNPTVFFIKAETDLLSAGKFSQEEIIAKLQEIKLFSIVPIISEKEFQYPLLTYKVNDIFWGQYNFDVIGNIFFHLSGYEDTVSHPHDIHGNIPDNNLPLIGYKGYPYVNSLLWMIDSFLHEAVSNNPLSFLIKKELWPQGEEYAFAVSHNIDSLQKWHAANLITSFFTDLKLLIVFKWGTLFQNIKEKINYLITNFEVYWNFEEIAEILHEHKVKATYFFGASEKKKNPLDIDYSLKDPDLQDELMRLKKEDNEIALLASYNSHKDKELVSQINMLSNTIGEKVKGIRHVHFQYDNPCTTDIHDSMDLLYDSTMSLQEHCGFRHGIAFPYKPFHPEKTMQHWEIPLSFSDTMLRLSKYSVLSKERAQSLIEDMVANIQKTNGLLTFDFSISNFNDIRYNSQLLEYILRLFSQTNCFCGTFAQIAQWWNLRAKTEVKIEDDLISVEFPEKVSMITFSLFGNRTIKKIIKGKGKISGKSVTLENVKKGETVILQAPFDDQIYLEIEEEE